MSVINADQKAALAVAHSFYRHSQGESYSFFVEQLQFNGIKSPDSAVTSLIDNGLLQRCGPRLRISDAGINAVESAALNLLEI